jgi:hypothetical protein
MGKMYCVVLGENLSETGMKEKSDVDVRKGQRKYRNRIILARPRLEIAMCST